jgi:ferritin
MLKSLLSKPVHAILNSAVQSELYASNLYKHIGNMLQRLGYFGGAKYFLAESADELTHYQRHADYMNDRGSVAMIPMIEAVQEDITGLREAIELAYETELQLGNDYEGWYKACADDPTTQRHLLFFLEEQQISVGKYGDLLARLNLAGDNESALLIIDKELG